jgi:hypothetical protein
MVDLNSDQRNLAVAAGTVYIGDVDPNAMPYGLRVTLEGVSAAPVEFPAGGRPQSAGVQFNARLNQGNEVVAAVTAIVPGGEHTLCRRVLVNDTDAVRTVSLNVRVEREHLAIDHNLNERGQDWVRLEI